MPIKFTPQFTVAGVIADVNKRIERAEDVIIDVFSQVGEQFIADARNEPAKWNYIETRFVRKGKQRKSSKSKIDDKSEIDSNGKIKKFYHNGKVYTRVPGEGEGFSDWTANLRSSIGYVIYKDGEPINETFPGDAESGLSKGKEVAQHAKVPEKGFALVVVAGMNYALYVENKNYDVITGSKYDAEKLLKQLLNTVRKNL